MPAVGPPGCAGAAAASESRFATPGGWKAPGGRAGTAARGAPTTHCSPPPASPWLSSTTKPMAAGSWSRFLTDYAELHCHTNFSFLEGASHPEELAIRAAELGLK